MPTCRIHVLGASGSGTTTLGRALAGALAVPHHDTDDYFWLPTDPPFAEVRPAGDRLALMEALFAPRPAWVLSGSLVGWGDPLIPSFDLLVFLRTATRDRIERLRRREAWLAALPCPVLRLDGGRPTAELAAAVMARLRPDRVTASDPGARSPLPIDDGVPPA